ncbi:hypothetical protein [uncultured Pseudoteredinibacter sp.]|uniref:hypothetical protein n=1 Tax=uncultured Pseudoteredinibacter sp. TaxID=1641701 RepID=UPI00260253E5|nr:hypothetical protein [uncultured Pseudoteredinibacter sp.]
MFKGILAAYRDLEKIERVGLWAAVFPMSLLLIFISVYERPPYILFDVSDMKRGELKVFIRRESAYLIVRLKPENTHFLRKSRTNLDVPIYVRPKRELNSQFRVFSVESKFGLKLLAYKQHRYPSRSCEYLSYVSQQIIIDDILLNGGIICNDPISERKRKTFVYDLSGRSVNESVAHLFSPAFSLEGGELKIGI